MIRKEFLFFVTCFFLLTGYAGCKKNGQDSAPSTPPDPSSAPSLPPVGVVDESAGFYVKVRPPKGVTVQMHKSTVASAALNSNYSDFNLDCTVPNSATAIADKDIFCIAETEELDLYDRGLDFQVNLPKERCQYMVERPYYYYGLEYGQGATGLTYSVNERGMLISTPIITPGGANSGVAADGKLWCGYDYLPTQPNCCYGTYSKTVTTVVPNPSGGFTNTTVTSIGDWGGMPGNCIVGPGGENPRRKGDNIPLSYIYSTAESGMNKTLRVKAPIQDLRGSNLYAANYFDEFKASPMPSPPIAIMPAGVYKGNPTYSWTCYDEGDEVIMRIRVAIREWNRKADFLAAIAGTNTVIHNQQGTEPEWPGEPYDDLEDWWKFVNGNGWNVYPGMFR